MAKWRGNLGFGVQSETKPGVWQTVITTKFARGDVNTFVRNELGSIEQGTKVNPDVTVRNQISVVMDAYSSRNFMHIKYVEWMGVKWKVTSVQVQRPRLVLSIGEIYIDPNAVIPEGSSVLGQFILGTSVLGD